MASRITYQELIARSNGMLAAHPGRQLLSDVNFLSLHNHFRVNTVADAKSNWIPRSKYILKHVDDG
jgi:hypothetical protein